MLLTKQPIWEAAFARRSSRTCCNLVRELKPLSKRVAPATACNFRIVKSSSVQAGISIKRRSLHIRNIPTASVRKTISCEPKLASVQGRCLWKIGSISFPTHSCTTRTSRIAEILSGLAGILIGKLSSNEPKTLQWPLFTGSYLTSPSSDSCKSGTLQK